MEAAEALQRLRSQLDEKTLSKLAGAEAAAQAKTYSGGAVADPTFQAKEAGHPRPCHRRVVGSRHALVLPEGGEGEGRGEGGGQRAGDVHVAKREGAARVAERAQLGLRHVGRCLPGARVAGARLACPREARPV